MTIDLAGPDGNVFALIGKATAALEQAGQMAQSIALSQWFRTVPPQGGVSYDDVRRMVEQYCEVTWLNGSAPPHLRKPLGEIAAVLGTGKPYLIRYDYTESRSPNRCLFMCLAEDVRGAAEQFWNQHPGEWFNLISVSDGTIEAFWQPALGKFVTIPEKDGHDIE